MLLFNRSSVVLQFGGLLAGLCLGAVSLTASASHSQEAETSLSLQNVVRQALLQDAWQTQNRLQQQALESRSQAAGELPDPQFSVTLLNLPTDTFSFDQEPLTQLIGGVAQTYPRGNTLALRRDQLQQQSEQHPLLSLNRQAQLVRDVSQIWLEAYKVRQTISLIQADRVLFDELVDISLASYSAALGRTQQQDIVRAELERNLLDDRLNRLVQRQEALEQQLGEWLGAGYQAPAEAEFPDALPQLEVLRALPAGGVQLTESELASLLMSHPSVQVLNKTLQIRQTGVDLAKQAYEPQWKVNASYGYRASDNRGNDRNDLVSFGVSFDLPVFSTVKQDSGVSAAVYQREAVKSERILLLRKMMAQFNALQVQRQRLSERQQRYTQTILPQMRQQAQAALNAYTADNGDFAEVVRARIAELNGRIDALAIAVEQQQLIARLNYLLATVEQPVNLPTAYSAALSSPAGDFSSSQIQGAQL